MRDRRGAKAGRPPEKDRARQMLEDILSDSAPADLPEDALGTIYAVVCRRGEKSVRLLNARYRDGLRLRETEEQLELTAGQAGSDFYRLRRWLREPAQAKLLKEGMEHGAGIQMRLEQARLLRSIRELEQELGQLQAKYRGTNGPKPLAQQIGGEVIDAMRAALDSAVRSAQSTLDELAWRAQEAESAQNFLPLEKLGLEPWVVRLVKQAGFQSAQDLLRAPEENLKDLEALSPPAYEKVCDHIRERFHALPGAWYQEAGKREEVEVE